MNNEKPYIEYNGTKYEFEASFRLKREYERDVQKVYKTIFSKHNLDGDRLAKAMEIEKMVKENSNLEGGDLTNEQISELLSFADLLDETSLTEVYEEYCFKMLNTKYQISREDFEKMLEGLAETYKEYGASFVDTWEEKVCEKVFTQQVENNQEKKPLPSWMQ